LGATRRQIVVTPSLSRNHVRALRVLAGSPPGCTEAVMLAHGFTSELLNELIMRGMASASAGQMMVAGRVMQVIRLRITAAGRKAIAR
jgi:hypothetical protein